MATVKKKPTKTTKKPTKKTTEEKPLADDLMSIWISKSLVETLIKIGKACEELLESQEGK